MRVFEEPLKNKDQPMKFNVLTIDNGWINGYSKGNRIYVLILQKIITKLFSTTPNNSKLRPPFVKPAVKIYRSALSGQAQSQVTSHVSPNPNEITLEQFKTRYQNLPELTAALGICEDRLPVLFDLTDARSGPIMIIGNAQSGKTSLLKIILHTAQIFQGHKTVRHLILAQNPTEYGEFSQKNQNDPICLGVFKPDTREALNALRLLVKTIEQRNGIKTELSPVILILDNFDFLPLAPIEMQIAVERILREGPSHQIWPLAALSTARAEKMGRWLRHFRTRLIGNMSNSLADRLGAFSGIDAEGLVPRRQFAVRVGEIWMPFWLPRLSR